MHLRTSSGPLHITASFGVTSVESGWTGKLTLSQMVSAADMALDLVKKRGRNCVESMAVAKYLEETSTDAKSRYPG